MEFKVKSVHRVEQKEKSKNLFVSMWRRVNCNRLCEAFIDALRV
jgi:hypothetical protein